jgi:hypothetical protein
MIFRRIVGAVAATAVATGATLLPAPSAGAATTVTTQLALSGVVTNNSATGGSVVGIHPGDTVDFKAAAVGLAADNAVADLLGSFLNLVSGYQIEVTPGAGFPSGASKFILGGPGGLPVKAVNFPAKGTYNFSWTAKKISVLGLAPVNLDGNDAAALGIKLNAKGEWVGQVVVADNPPAGGIGVQVPGVTASPSLPVVGQLPAVGLPGATTPTLPNILDPGVLTGLPPDGTKTSPSGNPSPGATTPSINYHSNGPSVADLTVPHGYGGGSGAASNYVPSGLGDSIGAPGTNFVTGSNATGATNVAAGSGGSAPKTVDVASSKSRSALDTLPTLLVVLAVIALSGATAFYARTFLLHKPATVKVKAA